MIKKNTLDKVRYQDSKWYIKLWRRRWYLMIIPWGLYFWLFVKDLEMPFIENFRLAKGLAQANMNWLYDWEAIKTELDVEDYLDKFTEADLEKEENVNMRDM